MNTIATYTVTIKDGAVTPIGNVPSGVVDYVQVIVDQNTQARLQSTITPGYSGNYQVTLYDTGNMEIVAEGAIGKAKATWPEVPASAPRASTVDDWLKIAPKMASAPSPSTKPAATPFTQPKASERDLAAMGRRRVMLERRTNRETMAKIEAAKTKLRAGTVSVPPRRLGAYINRTQTLISRQSRPGWRPAPGVIVPRTRTHR